MFKLDKKFFLHLNDFLSSLIIVLTISLHSCLYLLYNQYCFFLKVMSFPYFVYSALPAMYNSLEHSVDASLMAAHFTTDTQME